MHIKKPTQQQRILDLLKERGKEGVMVYEFMLPRPQGLGVAQYNARIFSLREKGHKIINKTPGHFVLQPTKEEKIEKLREHWVREPSNRKIIELQAKALKISNSLERKVKEVKQIFL